MNHQIERIIHLSNAFGPSGHEHAVQDIAIRKCSDICSPYSDTIKNTYLPLHTGKEHTILLDAHADEVGFIIQAIQNNGALRFLPLGGWDPKNIISCPVQILTQKGFVKGIVASRPVHFLSEADKNKPVDFSDLVIDVATSSKAETQALGIRIGDFVAPDVTCTYDEDRKIFTGKAFDCRIGCAALIETLHRLKDVTLNHNVLGLLSSQEEVGDRGIACAVEKIHPMAAICFEGCPADDTFEEECMIQSALKKGPMLRYFDRSMITHPEWMAYALKIADEENIPYQVSVRKGGGTNGGVLHVHDIPTIVIGIPVRFAHASVGYCSYEDYEHAVAFAVKIVQHISVDYK